MVEEVQPRADLQRRRFRSLRRVGWRGERNATRRLQLESGSSQQEDESDHGAMTLSAAPRSQRSKDAREAQCLPGAR